MKKNTTIITTKGLTKRKNLITKESCLKKDLLRIVKMPDGTICLDFAQNLPGRGAYITKNYLALQILAQKNLLARAFRTKINPEVYQNLMENFQLECAKD